MKNILGLDLGTNSIGWALISFKEESDSTPAIRLGSRIIPMSQDVLGKFDSGVTESQTAIRTGFRGMRRLRERCLLRRERLFRILHTLGFLPQHFDQSIGWEKSITNTYGKFKDNSEPKIAWEKDENGKMHFIFMDSFKEMLEDFSHYHTIPKDQKIPLDWTLYYLRKKALTQPITKQELAWILLSFNQKRGYYQLRGEDEEEEKTLKKEEYFRLKVTDVEVTDEKRGNDTWYNIYLENGWVYRRSSRISLEDWKGKTKEFIVTTQYEEDGSLKLDKDGNPKRSFRAPSADDWTLQKKRIEADIESSGKTVGEFIYDAILDNPDEKVRGKLVRTIERRFYKHELHTILRKQAEFIPELKDKECLEKCIVELYASNKAHQDSLRRKDLIYLITEDLLFYQRPLKSKKSLIADCPVEKYEYVDKKTGEIKIQHIKCIAKSNPYYNEFRLWQFVQNIRLFNREGIHEIDVTERYLASWEDRKKLFLFLNNLKEIKQDTLLKEFFHLKKPKGKDSKYPLRWNYVEDKAYPCNETRHLLLSSLKKANVNEDLIAEKSEEYRLWHLLYSVDDKEELLKALKSYAKQKGLPVTFVEVFKKLPPFKKEYGAYSEKAIKKLLRQLSEGVNVREACINEYGSIPDNQEVTRWSTPDNLQSFINGFKQYSLRNPIVEQVVLETLRTVHDLWNEYGHIDEIHVELGRSMKSTSDQRRRDTERIQQNENTNLRIKMLLAEMKNDSTIKDVRPFSPMQQDILRIYEEGALQTLSKEDADYAEISRISSIAMPTKSELQRYKLWLEQKYRSPYTGKTISLTHLFTSAYQIEHVIPQSRYFDDSFSNKVICEAEVNSRKSNMLGMEFIKKCGGEIIHCSALGDVKVFNENEYEAFVKEHYASNRAKARKLMMDDIPEEFSNRQMNDSRYISRVIMALLSNVVREEGEEEPTSKHLIPCTGGITDRLKKDWGLNDVWNNLVYPRFLRMNEITGSDAFGHWEDKDGKRVFQTSMPLELQRGFKKKRIDHRHHALDALVIALASRNIINYLNNESARDTQRREDLRQQLCDKNRIIKKPWPTLTQDAERALREIVVSFKHSVRIINKASNYYEHYNDDGKKVMRKQHSADQWAVRKPLHKETVYGRVNLRRIKEVTFSKALDTPESIVDKSLRKAIITMMNAGLDKKKVNAKFKSQNYIYFGKDYSKVEIFYFTDNTEQLVATRKLLDDSFDEKKIMAITDTGIQKILLTYLAAKDNNPKLAFSPEGIMEMNENIRKYNGDKDHKPIVRVRVSEPKGEKYNIGISGNNSKKYVEAQSGTNLYFAVYEDQDGKRSYQTIPLNVVAERLKQGEAPVPETNENGIPLKFYLSPNDLVYVPTEEERAVPIEKLQIDRIYKFVSSTTNRAYFIRNNIASVIANKIELFSLNKMEKPMYGEDTIKSICWKLEVDRLGKITKVIR